LKLGIQQNLKDGKGKKKMGKNGLAVVLAVMLVFVTVGVCSAKSYTGKKVLYIDSYHQGYAWSDGIVAGVKAALDGKGAELKVVYMDTKRNTDEAFKKEAGEKVKAAIEQYKPDVVIAADDNAQAYVTAKFYKDSSLPIVFCGVNWDAGSYGFPCKNVTGMLEVAPVQPLLEQLKKYAKGSRVGAIGPDNETNRKEAEFSEKNVGIKMEKVFVKDVEEWKKGFVELQSKVDMVIIDSDGGLYKGKEAELKAFIEANTKVPTGTMYDFMTAYAMIGFTKIAEEQGDWAATAALKILDGAVPSSIPVAKNEKGMLFVNARIAKALKADLPYDLLASAKVIE
jgi:ABC-type uncharacterized transport system substrate-binding protein